MLERYKGMITAGGGRSTAWKTGAAVNWPTMINKLAKAHYLCVNIEKPTRP